MRSIRRHLTVRLCVLAALLTTCGMLAVYFLARQMLVAGFDETLSEKAQALISVAEVDGEEIEIDPEVQQFAGFGTAFTGDYFEVRRASGEVILRFAAPGQEGEKIAGVPMGGEWRGDVTLPLGNPGRAAAFSFVPKGDREGNFTDLQLVVASDSRALRETLRAVLFVLLGTGIAGMGAAVVLIRLGLKRGLNPLNELAAEVQQLRVEEPGLRLEAGNLPDELGGVGEKLNQLLARVEESIARERRFSSHAAHELRTPLAELKIVAETIVKWPEEGTPERSAEMLEVIEEIGELLEKLLLLARTDAGAHALEIERIDLASSIERAIERERPQIKARGLQIQTRVQPGEFETDPVLWQTIVGNLLGNAVEYAPAESVIQVEASPQSFSVSNPAPNLRVEEIELMFERFWRKNTARTTGRHSGLGLAIVQAAVGLLGWECHATLEGGRIRVTVRSGRLADSFRKD